MIGLTVGAGHIFTGVGPLGWTRKFDWSDIAQVREDVHAYNDTGSGGPAISLVGKTNLKFGSMMGDERKHFLLHGLRVLHQRG